MKKHRFTNNKIQFQKHCNTPVFGLFLLWFTILFLHSCGIDRNIKKGEKFLAIGEYYDAATQFKTAYQRTPAKDRAQRGRLAAKMALCYDRISSSQRAIAAYRNVVRYKQDDKDTHLKLAANLMKAGAYPEAIKEYNIALDSIPDNEGKRLLLHREKDG